MHRFLLLVALLLSCARGGAARVAYEHNQEVFRAAAYQPDTVKTLFVVPLVLLESENVEGIGKEFDWTTRTQEHLVSALIDKKRSASAASLPPPPAYNDVVESYLSSALGEKETVLLNQEPDAAKTYLAYKTKIAELPASEWSRKWNEFATTFTTNAFVPLAKERGALLQQMPPRYTPDMLRSVSSGATHVVIPAGLKWVRSRTLIGGVERQVFSAELGIEVVETTNYEIVWRGYGIHKVDDQTQQPLDVSLQKAAENVVRAAL